MVSRSGYMSPEYAVDGRFSVKSDVFSMGVLMLEIMSAMKIKKKKFTQITIITFWDM